MSWEQHLHDALAPIGECIDELRNRSGVHKGVNTGDNRVANFCRAKLVELAHDLGAALDTTIISPEHMEAVVEGMAETRGAKLEGKYPNAKLVEPGAKTEDSVPVNVETTEE